MEIVETNVHVFTLPFHRALRNHPLWLLAHPCSRQHASLRFVLNQYPKSTWLIFHAPLLLLSVQLFFCFFSFLSFFFFSPFDENEGEKTRIGVVTSGIIERNTGERRRLIQLVGAACCQNTPQIVARPGKRSSIPFIFQLQLVSAFLLQSTASNVSVFARLTVFQTKPRMFRNEIWKKGNPDEDRRNWKTCLRRCATITRPRVELHIQFRPGFRV